LGIFSVYFDVMKHMLLENNGAVLSVYLKFSRKPVTQYIIIECGILVKLVRLIKTHVKSA